MIKKLHINEDLDGGNIRALAYSTADEIVKVLRKYNIQIDNTEYKKLKESLDDTNYRRRFNVLIYTPDYNNDYKLVIDLGLDPQSVWITADYRITFNAFGSNPSKKEFESIQKAVDEIQDIKSQYDRAKEKITNQFD